MTGCKNPLLSSFHPFPPPMESLPHSSVPLSSSPCLPVVFHHFRGPWDSKHDKVWNPACTLHTPPLVSTYGCVFHPDRFSDTERKLNISLKDYNQTMLWKWTASKEKSHPSCPDLAHFFQPFSGSLLKGVCRAVRTKRATNSRVMMEKKEGSKRRSNTGCFLTSAQLDNHCVKRPHVGLLWKVKEIVGDSSPILTSDRCGGRRLSKPFSRPVRSSWALFTCQCLQLMFVSALFQLTIDWVTAISPDYLKNHRILRVVYGPTCTNVVFWVS